jgi:multidrug efflux pump subunit AcrA (membrane-fusion protein)
MKLIRPAAVLILVALVVGAARSATTSDRANATVQYCQVFLIHDVDIPARETGQLRELFVEEGELLTAGTVLAQIDDREGVLQKQAAELERDAAIARAGDDIEVRYAVKSSELAEVELDQSLDINRKSPGAVPISEIRRLQLARHRSEMQIDRSELDLRVAQMTAGVQDALVQAADESIRRRRIISPFDGMVIEVFRQVSEWVNAGEPVARMVRLDELSVDGFLSGTDYDMASIADADVVVEVTLPRGRQARFDGKIVFVNPLIQGGNKFRIRATVLNRREAGHWLLRPGMTATMIIQ